MANREVKRHLILRETSVKPMAISLLVALWLGDTFCFALCIKVD